MILEREPARMLEIKTPSKVRIGSRNIAYDEVCPPEPKGTILLINGLAAKRLGWYKQIEVFGRSYRTIAPDNRDIGDSDPTPFSYSIKDVADDMAAFMHKLGIAQANIVGISMGGYISLELTLRHPELVKKLVLVSTSGGGLTNVPASPRLWPGFFRRRKVADPGLLAMQIYNRVMGPGFGAGHPEVMEDIARIGRYRPISAEAYSRQLRACLTHNAASRLGEIRVPTLVIHGDKDPLVPPPNGRRLARKIPGAHLIMYPGAGHVPILERSEQFNRDVLNFLDN